MRVTNAQAADWWQQSNQNLTKCLNLAVVYALRIEREKRRANRPIPKGDRPYRHPYIVI